jgi:RHS repeat-associated protein
MTESGTPRSARRVAKVCRGSWNLKSPIFASALDEALGAPPLGYAAGLGLRLPSKAVHILELRDRVLGAWQAGGTAAGVRWLVADQVGTPRMVVDQTGSLAGVTRHDYFPFGEDVPGDATWRSQDRGYKNDIVRQKFTGYERDEETKLDYAQARYFANGQGRFVSVDPPLASARAGNPQSWNRYSYSLNSPLRYADPSGLNPQSRGRVRLDDGQMADICNPVCSGPV